MLDQNVIQHTAWILLGSCRMVFETVKNIPSTDERVSSVLDIDQYVLNACHRERNPRCKHHTFCDAEAGNCRAEQYEGSGNNADLLELAVTKQLAQDAHQVQSPCEVAKYMAAAEHPSSCMGQRSVFN